MKAWNGTMRPLRHCKCGRPYLDEGVRYVLVHIQARDTQLASPCKDRGRRNGTFHITTSPSGCTYLPSSQPRSLPSSWARRVESPVPVSVEWQTEPENSLKRFSHSQEGLLTASVLIRLCHFVPLLPLSFSLPSIATHTSRHWPHSQATHTKQRGTWE